MPKKYQRKAGDSQDVARPYCLVRASVIRIYKVTGERKRVREEHRIGFVDEISAKNALQCRAEVLEAVNAERSLPDSQPSRSGGSSYAGC